MNLDAGNVSVFVEGRAGAAFVLWICLGIAVAAAAGLLLPWPPGPADSIMAAVIFLVCGAVVWNVGGSREVGFEPATRTVVEHVVFAGVPRERRTVLADDARVEVTQKAVKVAKAGTDSGHRTSSAYETRLHYGLALHSGSSLVKLDILDNVLEAERRALEVAARLGVRAVRSGYAVAVEGTSAVSTRQVVTVRDSPGVQSAIVALN
ncbi:MAG: hypothetical protein K8R60_08245 [Burkholderiales bacterium]|nr:hypothetical protein [Burkholderiales bacterium]